MLQLLRPTHAVATTSRDVGAWHADVTKPDGHDPKAVPYDAKRTAEMTADGPKGAQVMGRMLLSAAGPAQTAAAGGGERGAR
jgi:hypothetical protein